MIKLKFLDHLYSDQRPLIVFDGATGTSIQQRTLLPRDFGGVDLDGCNENLVKTRPSIVEDIHRNFLEVGCDVIETNTFGSNSIVLAEYQLEKESYQLNLAAASIASKLALEYSTSVKPRFVAGSMGPTTKLPSLGHIKFDDMFHSYYEQALGLIDGGIDLFLVETCQDVLQIKAAIRAIESANKERNSNLPIMVSVTIETTGTMLVGSDIGAVLSTLEPFNIAILGINCATGPVQMKEHIKYLSENSPFVISCIPNAGLPENIGGVAHYKLTPIEFKMQLLNFVEDYGVQIIGGCCGTTPEHILSIAEISKSLKPAFRKVRKSNKRTLDNLNYFEPSASSLYTTTNYRQDSSFLIIGERLNASGSKKVRDLLSKDDWDGLVSLAKDQVKENAHILDVNVDYVGRDGVRDMSLLVERLVTNVNLPIMLDSTEYQKMESGLKVAGGKCILNSTNYEDGDERFFKVLELAKNYGAGVVIGTIDEDGMARKGDKKFEIAKRAYKDAIEFGLPPYELFYDPLALPISTGIEEDRLNGSETIKAIELISKNLKGVHVILGVSNVSFGLTPAARITLNSVFLHECFQAGLDTAIVSPNKILPLNKIKEEHLKVCKDLIFDKRKYVNENVIYDPLTELTNIFTGITSSQARSSTADMDSISVEERLKIHIIEGEKIGLEITLDLALKVYSPLQIINTYLLDGMKVVGELFGSGRMQLPFVLQSAQTMKAAVSYLEPYMESDGAKKSSKARFLIATVKGDVHDIGKNLVDIILTNNGYEVINLGIKQDIQLIIDAQRKYQADCIAMSGLLVKSTAFMKDNLEAFNSEGINVPVILGGAALTPRFVNNDCRSVYKGIVLYGKDAFTDLRFMDAFVEARNSGQWSNYDGFLEDNNDFKDLTLGRKEIPNQHQISNSQQSQDTSHLGPKINEDLELVTTTRSPAVVETNKVKKPFYGNKFIMSDEIDLQELAKFIDKNALYSSQWQLKRKKDQTKENYNQFLLNHAEPILERLLFDMDTHKLLNPSYVYGYFPCGRINNSLRIFNETASSVVAEFNFPRQKSGNRYCIADFYNDLVNNQPKDFIAMQAVTMGDKAKKYAQKLYDQDNYLEYLYFHGLSVQLTEALAEFVHSRIRIECGFVSEEPTSIKDILAQRYRGCRYSFGYPACPNTSDSRIQIQLLEAHKIGLSMDESDQFTPEQSTTALIALHKNAKYFSA